MQFTVSSSKKPLQLIHLYFQVHQPRRLGPLRFLDIGPDASLIDDELNGKITRKVAKNCYLPSNQRLLRLIRQFPDLKFTFSISGVALEQFEQFSPPVIESFQKLAKTGSVEFLGETYYHSLPFLRSESEFIHQIEMHREKVAQLFGRKPTVFRNTELIYNNDIGNTISKLGMEGVILDGINRLRHSPNQLFKHPQAPLHILLRNYRLSDDIAFRFSDRRWKDWPLTPKKFLGWLSATPPGDEIITLAMDYETFGEHQSASTGIFHFLEEVLAGIAHHKKRFQMVTATEAFAKLTTKKKLSVPNYISWADHERDLSAWLGNDMQRDAFDTLFGFEKKVKELQDESLLATWRYLQTSDHFYYMSTKNGSDGQVHSYFSPYPSPHEAFINYMNALTGFSMQLEKRRMRPVRNAV